MHLKKKLIIIPITLILILFGIIFGLQNKKENTILNKQLAVYVDDNGTYTKRVIKNFSEVLDDYEFDHIDCGSTGENNKWIWSKNKLSATNINSYTACKVYFKPYYVNPPLLVENLIPVVYDESTDKWVMSNTNAGEWYDYKNQKWANAVTVVSDKRGTYSVGDPIEMEYILGMWVWIPRYEYNYTNLGDNYAGGTLELPGAIDIHFISGTDTTERNGYIIHPAFRNGSVTYTNNAYTTTSAYQMGGWDSEITGFWMGKFETSSLASATGITSEVLSDPIVKPDVKSRRYQEASSQFETILGLDTYHGITLDSHMSKNSEWGAVAYLSQSIYGKYGNNDYSGANKEVYANNSSGYYTGRSMGAPANTNGASSSAGGTTYQYNVSINGTGASTTGNIYGVYDMVGGSYDRQIGWLYSEDRPWGASGLSVNYAGFSSAPSDHKYYEEYTTTTTSTACGGLVCYGQALSETAGWYGDAIDVLNQAEPWGYRGGRAGNINNFYSGIMSFFNESGGSSANSITSCRAVLT